MLYFGEMGAIIKLQKDIYLTLRVELVHIEKCDRLKRMC